MARATKQSKANNKVAKKVSAKKTSPLGNVPRWSLADLYNSHTDPRIQKDLAWGMTAAKAFAKKYKNQLAKLSAKQLLEALKTYESMMDRAYRPSCYAHLLYATATDDATISNFQQKIRETANDIDQQILFFSLQLKKVPTKTFEAWLKSKELTHYRPWLRDMFEAKKYQLSDDVEEILHEKSVTGKAAWVRLYNETHAAMKYNVRGKLYTQSETVNLYLYHSDRKLRADAYASLTAGLKEKEKLWTLITNTLAKDKAIIDVRRGFKNPIDSRNFANQVEADVVNALTKSVVGAYKNTSHKYFALKAKLLKLDKLQAYDRLAPLPFEDDGVVTWTEAKDIVLSSFGDFSPQFAAHAEKFFSKKWIDAEAYAGKRSGAFCAGALPSLHPYILMNFQGKADDVKTLAHELGHGVHDIQMQPLGILQYGTPLTLAETASVFGETLVFNALMRRAKTKRQKMALLANRIEDTLSTVVRQIAFHNFETLLHDQRRKGELTAEQIAALWRKTQYESLGPAVELTPDYDIMWAYIAHFVHTPFYVYAYAFGACLSHSLYAVYEQSEPKSFVKKYMNLLASGGTQRHYELVKPFGLDTRSPKFWQQGLKLLERDIKLFEQLSEDQ